MTSQASAKFSNFPIHVSVHVPLFAYNLPIALPSNIRPFATNTNTRTQPR